MLYINDITKPYKNNIFKNIPRKLVLLTNKIYPIHRQIYYMKLFINDFVVTSTTTKILMFHFPK